MKLRRTRKTLPVTILLGLLLAISPSSGADPLDVLFPYEWVGNIDKIQFNEPSGIVFHKARGTLFVVGDEGEICEIAKDGVLIKHKHIRKADFEGITVDPASGLLYVAVEGEDRIIEFEPDSLLITREFPIERYHQGKPVLGAGGSGIEGITFVPDKGHPHGGTFFITNQSFNLTTPDDLSAIFEVEAPLRSTSPADSTASIIRYHIIGVTDMSGIHYDPVADRLMVVSDANNALALVSKDGSFERAYAFPFQSQEGITVDDEGFMYIAQDAGGIIKVRWLRE